MGLRERVQAILDRPAGTGEDRVHSAIDEIAKEVDRVSHALAIIDPEWEVIAKETIDPAAVEELLNR